MTFFTDKYGLAPSARLTLVETGEGSVNGYSAPGIVFLSPGTITKAVNTRLLSNQLSRQWWGGLVSPANRNHLWLENGPARLSELSTPNTSPAPPPWRPISATPTSKR